MKIEKTIRLNDGQRIHVMGVISPRQLQEYMKERDQDAFICGWPREQQSHYAMKKFIRLQFPKLSEWLTRNLCETSIWVDPGIFQVEYAYTILNFDWGIGFRSDDSKETIFTLVWS